MNFGWTDSIYVFMLQDQYSNCCATKFCRFFILLLKFSTLIVYCRDNVCATMHDIQNKHALGQNDSIVVETKEQLLWRYFNPTSMHLECCFSQCYVFLSFSLSGSWSSGLQIPLSLLILFSWPSFLPRWFYFSTSQCYLLEA